MLNPSQATYLRSASSTHQISMTDPEDLFSCRDSLGLKTRFDAFLEWLCSILCSSALRNFNYNKAIGQVTVAVSGTEGFALQRDPTGIITINIEKTLEERQTERQENWLQGMNRATNILGTRVSNPFLRILIQRIFAEGRVSEFAPTENSPAAIREAQQRLLNHYNREHSKWLDEHGALSSSINQAFGSRGNYANLDLFLWQYDRFVEGLTEADKQKLEILSPHQRERFLHGVFLRISTPLIHQKQFDIPAWGRELQREFTTSADRLRASVSAICAQVPDLARIPLQWRQEVIQHYVPRYMQDLTMTPMGFCHTDEGFLMGEKGVDAERAQQWGASLNARVQNILPLVPFVAKVGLPIEEVPMEFRLGFKDSQILLNASPVGGLTTLVNVLWLPDDELNREAVSMHAMMGKRQAYIFIRDFLRKKRPDIARFVERDFSIPYVRPENERRAHMNVQKMRNEITAPWRKAWLEQHFVPWYEEHVGDVDPEVIDRMSLDAPNWPLAFYTPDGVMIRREFTGHHFEETMHSLWQTYRFNVRHA